MQFGGASGSGFLSTPRREAANEALKAKGEFKSGIFTWFDELTARSTTWMDRRPASRKQPAGSLFSRSPATMTSW